MDRFVSRFSAAPLIAELRRRKGQAESWDELGGRLGVSGRTVERLMSATELDPATADRWAIRLGLHPVLLWPTDWVCCSGQPACRPRDEAGPIRTDPRKGTSL